MAYTYIKLDLLLRLDLVCITIVYKLKETLMCDSTFKESTNVQRPYLDWTLDAYKQEAFLFSVRSSKLCSFSHMKNGYGIFKAYKLFPSSSSSSF